MARDISWACERARFESATRDRFILLFDVLCPVTGLVISLGSMWLMPGNPAFGMELLFVWLVFFCVTSGVLRTTRHLLKSVKALEQRVAELGEQMGRESPKAS